MAARASESRRVVGAVAVYLMRRGWSPPRRLPERGFLRLVDDLGLVQGLATNALSPKETRTLTLLAHGLTLEQAAREAGVGRDTIKTQSESCVAKLGARNRTHAVALAVRDGLIELDEAA